MAGAPHSAKAIITQAANAHGIEPAILWGVFGTETAFGADNKTSSAGALGPLQLEPATAHSVGVKNPQDLAEAANGAAKYLAEFKGRGIGGMLSAYNAGPAGGYQAGYVNSTLANAKSYGSGSNIPIPAEPSTTSTGAVSMPGRPSRTERVTTANPRAAGFAQLASLIRSEKGGSENPLLSLGILAKAGAPTTSTRTIPGTVAQTSAGTAATGAEAEALAQAPANLSKPSTAPVKVTLPSYITGKGYPAVEKAKGALEREDHHPVSVPELERAVKQNPAGVQQQLNRDYGHEVVAEAPGGTVVKTSGGQPVYVPHKPEVKRGNFYKLTGQMEAGAPLPGRKP